MAWSSTTISTGRAGLLAPQKLAYNTRLHNAGITNHFVEQVPVEEQLAMCGIAAGGNQKVHRFFCSFSKHLTASHHKLLLPADPAPCSSCIACSQTLLLQPSHVTRGRAPICSLVPRPRLGTRLYYRYVNFCMRARVA